MTPPGTSTSPGLDVFLAGLLFVDVVLTGLDQPPVPGVEVSASGLGTGPGGIANIAVTCARLGLATGLATVCGDDPLGRCCWDTLREEGIDLTRSQQRADWRTPVTVALAYHGDRALVTHGAPPPLTQDALVGRPPVSATAFVHLDAEPSAWRAAAHRHGTRVYADVGWDPTQRWSTDLLDQLETCYAFVPNEVEALAYTRTDSVERALAALADRVPLAVVTRGVAGASGMDAATGRVVSVPALPVDAVDTTGAGDAFAAGLILAGLRGWPLDHQLRFAALVSGLSVTRPGGAAAAPGWPDIAAWWSATRADPAADETAREYRFLDDVPDVADLPHDVRPSLTALAP